MTTLIAPKPESIPEADHDYLIGELVGVRDLDGDNAVLSIRARTSAPKAPYATVEVLVGPSTEQGRHHVLRDDDGNVIDIKVTDGPISVGDEVQACYVMHASDGRMTLVARSVHAID